MKTSPQSDGAAGAACGPEEKARAYGLEYVAEVTPGMLDPSLTRAIPVSWARSRMVLPARRGGENLLLCADPANPADEQYVSLATGESFRAVVTDPAVLLEAIERCYYRRDDSPGRLIDAMQPTGTPEEPGPTGGDLLEISESAPVTRLVNLILLEAVKQNASDIHFEPFASTLILRYRIDGILYDRASPPKSMEPALLSRLKVMARLDIAERRLPQDGMAQVRVGGRAIDIRVSTAPVADGERMVLRLLNREQALHSPASLGMDAETLRAFQRLAGMPNGMLIVSGPTGSGKTTTLYAALSGLNAERSNILTIEDPVEYRLPRIGQIQVKPKIGLTFAMGLRHILRQDPDVIMVGEMRDLETAEIAVRASLTGHRVFTTLHTNDAPAAIMRLVDMGIEPYLLASCLRGVIGQRLVRRLCPECRRETHWGPTRERHGPDAELLRRLERADSFYEADPRGCPACLEGYKGRTGLFELMVCTRALGDAVHRGRLDAAALREVARGEGMRSLVDDGVDKIVAGVSDVNEVLGALRS